jgi:hypothetical protein
VERSGLSPPASGSFGAVHEFDRTEEISVRKSVGIAEEPTVLGEGVSIHRRAGMDDEWSPMVGTPAAVLDILTALDDQARPRLPDSESWSTSRYALGKQPT